MLVCLGLGVFVAWHDSLERQRPPETITASVSSYCLCSKCCGKWASVFPRVTASGHVIKPGDKIAAHKTLPFGTIIDVPGRGRYEIQDRFPGEGIDLLVWEWDEETGETYGQSLLRSHEIARQFGRQTLEVKVMR